MSMSSLGNEAIQTSLEFVATDEAVPGLYLSAGLVTDAGRLALAPYRLGDFTDIHPVPSYREADMETLTADEYSRVLRRIIATPHGREAIRVATEARKRYEIYETAVDRLLDEVDSGAVTPLGVGTQFRVYPLVTGAEKLAVHVPRQDPVDERGWLSDIPAWYGSSERYSAYMTADLATTLALGHGAENAAQLVSYSTQANICISKYIPGKLAMWLNERDVARISFQDIGKYVKTVAQLAERGLQVDFGYDCDNATNIMWHPSVGFSIIDYLKEPPTEYDLQDSMRIVVKALTCKPLSFGARVQQEDPAKARLATPLIEELHVQATKLLGIGLSSDLENASLTAAAH
jgi:hypothetical protein